MQANFWMLEKKDTVMVSCIVRIKKSERLKLDQNYWKMTNMKYVTFDTHVWQSD